MTTQAKTEQKLLDIIKNKEFKHSKWKGRFSILKLVSTAEKGDLGEDFLAALLKDAGYLDVGVVNNRRGDYDVSLEHNKKTILFEVKVATRDTSHSFQFNGIRCDRQFTHLFCLGISPDRIGFLIISKNDVMDSDKHTLISMAKGDNAVYKITKKGLSSFNDFSATVKGLVE